MYVLIDRLLIEWEGRTGKYLPRGHGVYHGLFTLFMSTQNTKFGQNK